MEFPLLSCPIKQVPTFAWTRFLYEVYPSLLCYRMAEGGVWVLQWKNRTLLEIATRRYLSTDDDKQITSAIIADYFSGKMATMQRPAGQLCHICYGYMYTYHVAMVTCTHIRMLLWLHVHMSECCYGYMYTYQNVVLFVFIYYYTLNRLSSVKEIK